MVGRFRFARGFNSDIRTRPYQSTQNRKHTPDNPTTRFNPPECLFLHTVLAVSGGGRVFVHPRALSQKILQTNSDAESMSSSDHGANFHQRSDLTFEYFSLKMN
jgi:hypothetical protein